MSQSLGSFNRGTKSLEVMMKQGQVIIDTSSLVAWAFQNVELKVDAYGNCKPVKANNQIARKIDPVIAIIEALSAYLFDQYFQNVEMITLKL